jgi:hypothetical protein
MKTFPFSTSLLFALTLCSFFFVSITSSGKDFPYAGSPGTTITSMVMTSGTASSLILAPASLYVTVLGSQVTVQWSQSIGQAELTVEDQTGQVVVDDVVNTQSTSSYTIDMTGFDSETYTVILKSSTKQVSQNFTLN